MIQLEGTSGRSGGDLSVLTKDLGYEYPEVDGKKLDLRPTSDLTYHIVNEINKRCDESFSIMQARHSTCMEIDQVLTAYVPLKDWEERKKTRDSRRPIAVVVPTMASNLDTLMTYQSEVFFGQAPMFAYEGVGPEDELGAKLLELKVQMDVNRARVALPVNTILRDGFVYGFGVGVPNWSVRRAQRTRVTFRDVIDMITMYIKGDKSVARDLSVVFEGNTLDVIDPYRFMPDVNMPIHDLEAMEFINWSEISSVYSLLQEEQDPDTTLFNVRYLKEWGGNCCTRWTPDRSGRPGARMGRAAMYKTHSTEYTTLVNSYMKIIPSKFPPDCEQKIGKSERVEKWFFTVADGKFLIDIRPAGLDHGMFPLVVNAPDFDGYSTWPVGRMEQIYGLQVATNFELNSYMENTIRSLMNLFLVDPLRVNLDDILRPVPAGVIRLAEEYWGTTDVREVFSQLRVENVTQQNIMNLPILTEIMEKSTAATDIVQGLFRSGRGDRSAYEAQTMHQNAVSRLKRQALITSLMFMQQLGYFFACHTQQFLSQPMYVRQMGDWPEVLQREFKARAERDPREQGLRFGLDDLQVDFDVVVKDGSQPVDPGRTAQGALEILRTISGFQEHPDFQRFELFRFITRIVRRMGLTDFHEFFLEQQETEQTMRGAEAGNLATVDQLLGEEVA